MAGAKVGACILLMLTILKLMRGNPFVNKISIGGESPLVPPLPGRIGSRVTGGIAKHGGFEGTLLIFSLVLWA
jgi:hypothetical protein